MESDNNVSNQREQYAMDANKSVMSMGEWLITRIVCLIPCVGIIMMFVWAFGNGNENRKNYCRASLILTAIGIVLGIILYATIFAGIIAAMSYY